MPDSFTQPNTQTPKILAQSVDITPISMLPGLSVSSSKVISASSGYHKYHAHLVQNPKVCLFFFCFVLIHSDRLLNSVQDSFIHQEKCMPCSHVCQSCACYSTTVQES